MLPCLARGTDWSIELQDQLLDSLLEKIKFGNGQIYRYFFQWSKSVPLVWQFVSFIFTNPNFSDRRVI